MFQGTATTGRSLSPSLLSQCATCAHMTCVYRYAMEAVSSLELGGIIYPRCDQYGAGMAGAGGAGGALAPGQHVPTGEASTPVSPQHHHLRSPCCSFILQDMCLHSDVPCISDWRQILAFSPQAQCILLPDRIPWIFSSLAVLIPWHLHL